MRLQLAQLLRFKWCPETSNTQLMVKVHYTNKMPPTLHNALMTNSKSQHQPPTFPTASTATPNTRRCSGNAGEKNSYNQRITETEGKHINLKKTQYPKGWWESVLAWGGWWRRIQEPSSQLSQWASQPLAEASPCRVYSTVSEHLSASLFSTVHTPHKRRLSHETRSAL